MQRRLFIAGLGTLLTWPGGAAVAAARVARLGFLGFAPASAWTGELASLRTGLRDLGYIEGQHYVFEFKWADSVDQMPAKAM